MGAYCLEPWSTSPAYCELMEARASKNSYQFLTLVKRLVANSTGAERAFWLCTQTRFLVESCIETNEIGAAWDHLASLVPIAAEDPTTRETVRLWAMAMLYVSEDVRRYKAICSGLGRGRGRSLSWNDFYNHGLLCLKRGYWVRQRNLLARAIAAFRAQSEAARNANQEYLVHLLAFGAIGCVATGLPDLAEARVREAEAALAGMGPENANPVALVQAQAELHLYRGEYQQARTALQTALGWTETQQGSIDPVDQITMLLLVARIARAEGNQEGFLHFCDQALALCTRYRLPMSEKRVRTLLAGAER